MLVGVEYYQKHMAGKSIFGIDMSLVKEDLDEIKRKRGFIYVVRSQGFYKIGRTKNKESRTRKYVTENPLPIEFVVWTEVDACWHVERELHKALEPKRYRSEWYRLEDGDVEKIKKALVAYEV